ncbi:MAG: hypothetical protein U5R14_08430 [Gemmatimonadota bacterium]|nr:hypothetical protein [Gemmatimonadota bacterium]
MAVVEGEKDADRLTELGIVATTCPGGAGKWRREYSEALRGQVVVIIIDNDEPGREHAQQVARSLHGVAKTVKVLELPDLPPKGDVSDWLDVGGSVKELKQLARVAPEWEPGRRRWPNAPKLRRQARPWSSRPTPSTRWRRATAT